jgi:hypothetical protein
MVGFPSSFVPAGRSGARYPPGRYNGLFHIAYNRINNLHGFYEHLRTIQAPVLAATAGFTLANKKRKSVVTSDRAGIALLHRLLR